MTNPVGDAERAPVFMRTPKRRSLHQDEHGELVLSFYPSGYGMAEHSHGVDQRSIILSGGLAEETPSGSAVPGARHLGLKAAGVRHENRYGPDGALILSLNASPQSPSRPGPDWGWSPSASALQVGAVLSAFAGQAMPTGDELFDLHALLSDSGEGPEPEAPPWLLRVHDAVRSDPDGADLQAMADEAGVHRVHLSRAYSRHFRAPISLDRRRARMGRAVKALIEDGMSAAEAAYEAGFSDQPHLARTLKIETGLTPRKLMRIFSEASETKTCVTSVQDDACHPA